MSLTSLAVVNTIIGGPISLPPKYTMSCNTMPFVLNYYPTSLTGTGLTSRTSLDYYPPTSFAYPNIQIRVTPELIDQYLFEK